MSSWPTAQEALDEIRLREREEHKRLSERERKFLMLRDVEHARRQREQAKRRVEHESDQHYD